MSLGGPIMWGTPQGSRFNSCGSMMCRQRGVAKSILPGGRFPVILGIPAGWFVDPVTSGPGWSAGCGRTNLPWSGRSWDPGNYAVQLGVHIPSWFRTTQAPSNPWMVCVRVRALVQTDRSYCPPSRSPSRPWTFPTCPPALFRRPSIFVQLHLSGVEPPVGQLVGLLLDFNEAVEPFRQV